MLKNIKDNIHPSLTTNKDCGIDKKTIKVLYGKDEPKNVPLSEARNNKAIIGFKTFLRKCKFAIPRTKQTAYSDSSASTSRRTECYCCFGQVPRWPLLPRYSLGWRDCCWSYYLTSYCFRDYRKRPDEHDSDGS